MTSIFRAGEALDRLEDRTTVLSAGHADLSAAQSALVEQLDTLSSRLAEERAVLTEQVATLVSQLAISMRRLEERDDEVRQLRDRIATLDADLAERSERLEQQGDRIAALGVELAHQTLRCDQNGGDIARIERQAAIDLAEMRETTIALAEAVLKPPRIATAAPPGDPGESYAASTPPRIADGE